MSVDVTQSTLVEAEVTDSIDLEISNQEVICPLVFQNMFINLN